MIDQEDLNRILHGQDDWPHWPFLPMKKRTKDSFGWKFGVIIADNLSKVIISNLFMLPDTVEELMNLNCEEYESVEAMLEDGWIVD